MIADVKQFFRHAALFALIFLCVLTSVNFAYQAVVLPRENIAQSDQQFYQQGTTKSIIFFGDSHVLGGVDSVMIGDAFNFASAGENYFQTYYKFKTITEQSVDTQPTMIVLPLDIHSFSSFRSDRVENIWYWRKYIPWQELFIIDGTLAADQILSAYLPVIGHGSDFFAIKKTDKMVAGHLEKTGNFSKSARPQQVANNRAKFHLGNSANPVDPKQVSYFSKILELAQQQNITVVLVKYPVSEQYYEATTQYFPLSEQAKMYEEIEALARQYGVTNVLDYQQRYFAQLNYFADSDHLNKGGADVFSEALKADLLSLSYTKK